MAIKRLQSEYKQYMKDPNYLYSLSPNENNFLLWDVIIIGPPETPFEGGLFECKFEFSTEYPNKPPNFSFKTLFPHPNIYKDGRVCISILHEGNDSWGYEHISERWNPSHSVNSILMSIILLLTNPNYESPANVEASLLCKNNYELYKNEIYKIVANTQK